MNDKASKRQRLIKNLGLKQINKDAMDQQCRKTQLHIERIRTEYPEFKYKQASDFNALGVLEEKEGLIPAFNAKCGFKLKSKGGSKEGSSVEIKVGLNLDPLCGSTKEKPIIAIPYEWYDEDPYHHICVKTKP